MKSLALFLLVILMSLSTRAFAQTEPNVTPAAAVASAAEESFELLKSLAGEWEGVVAIAEMPEITPRMHVSIRVTSRGNVVMHEFQEAGTLLDPTKFDHPITMFYVDEEGLNLVHYCDAGNRPRMIGTRSEDGKTFDFELVEIGGDPTRHMHHIVFKVIDANTHVEEFTFMMGDKPMHARFELRRTESREDWTAQDVAVN